MTKLSDYELLLKIKTGAYFRKKLQNIQNIHADQLLFDMWINIF